MNEFMITDNNILHDDVKLNQLMRFWVLPLSWYMYAWYFFEELLKEKFRPSPFCQMFVMLCKVRPSTSGCSEIVLARA